MVPCSRKNVAENAGYGGLEWTRLPGRRSKRDEQVEAGTEHSEGGDDGGDRPTEVLQVPGQSVSEEEEGELYNEGKTLHDELEAPSDHPLHPEFPVSVAVDERSFGVEVEPPLSQHGKECGEQRAREGSE